MHISLETRLGWRPSILYKKAHYGYDSFLSGQVALIVHFPGILSNSLQIFNHKFMTGFICGKDLKISS